MSELPTCLRPVADGLELELLVQPRASRSRVVGLHDGRLKIQLAAAPVDGEANAALVELLCRELHRPRASVTLRRGEASRRKTVHLSGWTVEQAGPVLATWVAQ